MQVGGGGGGGGVVIIMRRSLLNKWQHGTELIDDAELTRTLLSVHVAFNYLYSRTSQYMPIQGKRWNPLHGIGYIEIG